MVVTKRRESKKCNRCGLVRQWLRGERKPAGKMVVHWRVDALGRRWFGSACPECATEARLEWSRKMFGSRPRNAEHPNEDVAAAYGSEVRVAEMLRARGWHVDVTTSRGPDLVVYAQGTQTTVEVKRASKHPRKNSWTVTAVMPRRRGDDMIAIVFPCGAIYSEPMAEHLRNCGKTGTRTVTGIYAGMGPRNCETGQSE